MVVRGHWGQTQKGQGNKTKMSFVPVFCTVIPLGYEKVKIVTFLFSL